MYLIDSHIAIVRYGFCTSHPTILISGLILWHTEYVLAWKMVQISLMQFYESEKGHALTDYMATQGQRRLEKFKQGHIRPHTTIKYHNVPQKNNILTTKDFYELFFYRHIFCYLCSFFFRLKWTKNNFFKDLWAMLAVKQNSSLSVENLSHNQRLSFPCNCNSSQFCSEMV